VIFTQRTFQTEHPGFAGPCEDSHRSTILNCQERVMRNAIVSGSVLSESEPALPNISATEIASQPSILVVEPLEDLAASVVQLATSSQYRVTTAKSQLELLGIRRDERFSLAALDDVFGQTVLRLFTEYVRRTWPATRILILRHTDSVVEDHLYDEMIDCPFESKELLDVLARMIYPARPQRPDVFHFNPEAISRFAGGARSNSTTWSESDPTKANPDDLETEQFMRERPARERRMPEAW
jgi:hypothetical protein